MDLRNVDVRRAGADGTRQGQPFRHEALMYAGEDDFLEQASSFIRDGVAAHEPILVVVSAGKIDMLRSELGSDADEVRFADMADVGQNPARIIPAWTDFVEENVGSDRRLRGIGEPIWKGRGPDELVECHRHEALLNLAFATAPAWWLLCPYDMDLLEPDVIEEAHRTHPHILQDGTHRRSEAFMGLESVIEPFGDPLPEPDGVVQEMGIELENLDAVRRFVARHAAAAGLGSTRMAELTLVVNEVATNSVRYGGGSGLLRVWCNEDALVCEIRDQGRIHDPMVGRQRPEPGFVGGYGLWLVNQLCDLAQIRTFETGNVVRIHTYKPTTESEFNAR